MRLHMGTHVSPGLTPSRAVSPAYARRVHDALRRRAREGLVSGAERAPARAHFRAMGIDPARLGGPIVGVVSTWTQTMPCNLNQLELAARVGEGVTAAGGVRSASTRSPSPTTSPRGRRGCALR